MLSNLNTTENMSPEKKKVLNSYDFDAIFDNETTSSDYFVRSSLCIYIQVILHFLYIVRGNHTFVSHSLFQLRPVCSIKNHFSLFFFFFSILYDSSLIICVSNLFYLRAFELATYFWEQQPTFKQNYKCNSTRGF